eukprot:GAHX01002485.1.p1 GENE.GAHX01002485.1~~GAHX01002485.1.p1  ORF type:complete len:73 (+),score=9.41 GAHX01002485.1:167-385(+)
MYRIKCFEISEGKGKLGLGIIVILTSSIITPDEQTMGKGTYEGKLYSTFTPFKINYKTKLLRVKSIIKKYKL